MGARNAALLTSDVPCAGCNKVHERKPTLMPMQGVASDSAPTKHSVRVEWFRREPGGSTIFVKPAGPDGVAPRQAGDGAAEVDLSH